MNTRFLLPLLAILLSASVARGAETCDTLFTASSAKALYIVADQDAISVTVRNFDNRNENYYYSTSNSDVDRLNIANSSKFKDVKNISIVEINSRQVNVSFVDATEAPSSITLGIPDPDNRTLSSYVGKRQGSFGVPLSRSGSGKSKWDLISTGLGMGWVTPVNPTPSIGASMGHSLEFTWTIVAGVRWSYGPHALMTGLGLDWRNYSLRNSTYFSKDASTGVISLDPFEPEMSKCSSRLQTFSLQIPLLYRFQFGNRNQLSFALGPVLNFNTGAHIVTKYAVGTKRSSVNTAHIGQNPVTVDVMGEIGWRTFGLYARYAPMRVLKESTGLDFRSFSTGFFIYF